MRGGDCACVACGRMTRGNRCAVEQNLQLAPGVDLQVSRFTSVRVVYCSVHWRCLIYKLIDAGCCSSTVSDDNHNFFDDDYFMTGCPCGCYQSNSACNTLPYSGHGYAGSADMLVV